MSTKETKSPEENIYLFFGLKDFESDESKVKLAHKRLSSLYHLHSSGGENTGENKRFNTLKDIFPELDDASIHEFAQDKMQKATEYYAILNPRKNADGQRTHYDLWLKSQADLLQSNPQKAPWALVSATDCTMSLKDKAIAALARHHKLQDDLAEQDRIKQHAKAMKGRGLVVREDDADSDADIDEDDFQASEAQGPDVSPQGDAPDPVQQSFQNNAREQCIYPPDGEKSALYGSPMVLEAVSGDYGNIDLNVLSGIDGKARTTFGRENGFTLAGKLTVGAFGVKSNDQQIRKVAITGTLDIKCNGAFINGDVDGRIRKAKIGKQKVQNEQGQIVERPVESESFKKGAIEIDAGDQDVVINGDMLGKVKIKTRGNIRVIGNVSDKVHLHAGGSIEVYGDVTGNCKMLAHGEVTIRGKKQWSVQTTERVSVHSAAIDPEYREALRQHIATGEAPKPSQDKERAKASESFKP
tara:strand:- start:82602 stop:84011 length:1410 start_codon:yes stop_codon:yes gene_type:complete